MYSESEELVHGAVQMVLRLLDQIEEAPLRVGLDIAISLLLEERCCAFMEGHIEVVSRFRATGCSS